MPSRKAKSHSFSLEPNQKAHHRKIELSKLDSFIASAQQEDPKGTVTVNIEIHQHQPAPTPKAPKGPTPPKQQPAKRAKPKKAK